MKVEPFYFKNIRELYKVIFLSIRKIKDPQKIIDSLIEIAGSEVFHNYCNILANRMVTLMSVQNAKTWREACKKSSQGRKIFLKLSEELNSPKNQRIISNMVLENAQYISKVPEEIAQRFTRHTFERHLAGVRAEEISRELINFFPEISTNKACLIARTESSKANTIITEVRAKSLGLNWYQWQDVGDSRTREAHKKMNGVLINWNDPPAPEELNDERSAGHYHAGCIYNCRCIALPVVDLSLINWPAKVYYGQNVVKMTRTQFERIAA